MKLRQALRRYAVRAQAAFATLAKVQGDVDAGDLPRIGASLDSIRLQHAALTKRLQELAARWAAGDLLAPEERRRFPMLDAFEQTDHYVRVGQAAAAGGAGAVAAAAAFFKAHPEAGLLTLSENAGRIDQARQALVRGRAALQQTPADTTTFSARAREAHDQLTAFRAMLGRLAADDTQQRLDAAASGLLRQLDSLAHWGDDTGRGAVNRKLFDLGAAFKVFGVLQRELAAIAADQAGAAPALAGGPAVVQEEVYRYHRSLARRRLQAQLRLAERRVVKAAMAALSGEPDAGAAAAVTWAAFAYRLVRSELSGIGGVRVGGSGRGGEAEPHMRFLLAELEKARAVRDLRVYAPVTKEYLRSAGDVLRY
jgi:small-conductance mechanosensitive channel